MESEDRSGNPLERHPRLALAVLLLFLLLGFEAVLRVAAAYGVIPIRYYPTASASLRFLGDINRSFGVWHFPNAETRYIAPCYDVVYHSNSYGARDKEREKRSPAARRAVVLGDSFIEGVGVRRGERLTDLLEEETGIEHLNFGTSGSFGSIQEWLLYRDLGLSFDHSEVFIFLLPANDFRDNRPDDFSRRRYRPYLKKNSEGRYEVYYTTTFEKRKVRKELSMSTRLRRHLYNNVYMLNVIRGLGGLLEERAKGGRKDLALGTYDDYTEEDLAKLLYSYEEIIGLAGPNRRVSIVVIPRHEDFIRAAQAGLSTRLVTELERFAARFPNVRVLDLLPGLYDRAQKLEDGYQELFHACDGHWSPLGNKLAAEIVIEAFYRDSVRSLTAMSRQSLSR